MKDRMFEALKRSTADYAEIRLETEDHTWLGYRKHDIEHATTGSYIGGMCRACVRGGWGVVTFDSVEDLGHQVAEACACAALAGRRTSVLAGSDPVSGERLARMGNDFRGVPLDAKLKLLEGYNRILLDLPGVESTHVAYGDQFRSVHFANSRGSWFHDERPRVTCMFWATARDGSLVQQAWDSVASPQDYGKVAGLEDRVRAVGERAVALLKAPKVEGGAHDVILDPELAGCFVHEAFGHLSEADFLHENPKMRELMHLGRRVGPPMLDIYDDGTIPGADGTLPWDDEGTPMRRNWLVKGGVLDGHLHSLETAGRMAARPTGNARAIGRHHAPIVRMTNTCIGGGDTPLDRLFAGVERGIYARGSMGGQTALEQFTFSASWGHRIENGKVGELVRDVVLSGNVFRTLDAIDGLGDDFALYGGAGGCGKGGQWPLPVSFGSPHVRIRGVVIGGK